MEKLNWKVISASPGYRSLKAAYVKDVQGAQNVVRRKFHAGRKKQDYRRIFKEVIGFVMKYSSKWGVSFVEILNHWEQIRGPVWWLGFYQESTLARNKPASVR